jgi:hypothetical protein
MVSLWEDRGFSPGDLEHNPIVEDLIVLKLKTVERLTEFHEA